MTSTEHRVYKPSVSRHDPDIGSGRWQARFRTPAARGLCAADTAAVVAVRAASHGPDAARDRRRGRDQSNPARAVVATVKPSSG